MFTRPTVAANLKDAELEAMKKRLAGAKTNKMAKKPPLRQRTVMNFGNKAVK